MKGIPAMSLGRVLLVDDDEGYGPALREQLRRAGFDCDLAASAEAARQALEAAEYDFALIDVHLSDDLTLCDGVDLYDELERDYPGMEIELFTAKPDSLPPGTRRTFHLTPEELSDKKTQEIETAILRGVNKGLRLRLEWNKKVMDGLSARFGVLNEKGRVLWEAGTDQTGWIQELLANEASKKKPSQFYQAIAEGKSFRDQVPSGDKWLRCELSAMPQTATGSLRLLTVSDTTRAKQAADLAQEFLQYDKFEVIAARICNGMIELGFRRARLWLLQGDDCTLALCWETGHALSSTDVIRCAFDHRHFMRLRELLTPRENGDNEDAVTVSNPADYLPLHISKLLKVYNSHQSLAIPLFVRNELIGLLMVDKVGAGGGAEAISLDDSLIGKSIGRVAAAAIDRGIHEWQFQRFQSILSQVQASLSDDEADGIYSPVLNRIIESLGNDPTAPWLPQFKGAEIAVRAHRFDREYEFKRIFVTPGETDVFPPTVDISHGLVGEVMDHVRVHGQSTDRNLFAPRVFSNIFKRKLFQKQFLSLRDRRGPTDPYVRFLSTYPAVTMLPLFDLDREVLGFLCFHALPRKRSGKATAAEGRGITRLHKRWLEVLGQLCSRILEIRERHRQSMALFDELYGQMASNEAMAKFGVRSANITHQIKHFCQDLIISIDLLREDIRDGHTREKQLDRVNEIAQGVFDETERVTALASVFDELAMEEAGRATVLEAVEKSRVIVANRIQESGARVETALPPDLPELPMTLDQAVLVFTNLIRNASESIRECGRPAGLIDIRADWAAPHLTVTVADNGGGIAKENRDRLFQIGFTTKRGQRGMGVGLCLVRRIVTNSRGTITVDPAPAGQGATFRMVFTLSHAGPSGVA